MLLASHLGAGWRRIFRRDPDQIPDDLDQAIAMIIDVSAKLGFSGDMVSYENSSFLGATRNPRVSTARYSTPADSQPKPTSLALPVRLIHT